MTNSKSEMKRQNVQRCRPMTPEQVWARLELCETRDDEVKLLVAWRAAMYQQWSACIVQLVHRVRRGIKERLTGLTWRSHRNEK